jgi:hypothetical protein
LKKCFREGDIFFKCKMPYICIEKVICMVIVVKKNTSKKHLNDELQKIVSSKKFDARQHLGKVKWGEDALEYQKKLRDEWD